MNDSYFEFGTGCPDRLSCLTLALVARRVLPARGMRCVGLSGRAGGGQARSQVEQLQGMSDEQIQRMMKSAVSVQQMLQKGKQAVKSPWFRVVVLALVFLVLAIIVRFL
jgi:hypothetical protein